MFKMRDIYIDSSLNSLTKFESSERTTKINVNLLGPIKTRIINGCAMKSSVFR